MPRFFTVLIIVAFAAAGAHAQAAECAKLDAQGNPKCCNATGFGDCPTEGCGVDGSLNTAKNRTDIPNEAEVQQKTIAKIAAFKRPKVWAWNQSRALLESWGEGTPLRVTLYLQKVSKYPGGAEACNCNLKGEENNDYHLVLGRTKNAPEKQSMTAEITPRIRRTNWTYERLNALADERAYVRVTGWAMLDTQHIGKPTPVRRTHWEIHPVTQIEVCTATQTECNAGTGWTPLEQIP